MNNINWDEFFIKKFSIKVSNEYQYSLLVKHIPIDKCYDKNINYKYRSEKGWYIGDTILYSGSLHFSYTSYGNIKSYDIKDFMTDEELKNKLEEERAKYMEEQKKYWEQIEKNRDLKKEKEDEFEAMAYLGKKRCIEAEINLEYMQERDYDKWLDFHPTIK